MAIDAKNQFDFSGGMNTVTNPLVLRRNQVQSAINLLLDEHGSVRVRDGTLIQGSQSPSPTFRIAKLYDLILASGTIVKTAILYDSSAATNNKLYNRTTWALLGTFSSAFPLPDMITFTNLAIISGDQTNPLKSYDGAASFVALTGAPAGGVHIANHLNYLWVGNTAAATNYGTLVGPSSLQCSAIVDPNSWPAANQTWISPDDGQTIQSLALFTIAEAGISPTAALIIWKDFSGYEATGVLGTATFAVQRIKSDMGCVAPRSVQFVSGFGIMRLSHRGFALYDGVNDELISEEIRPYLFGRDSYTGIDWTNVNLSYASQVANPPLYVCACPTTGSNGALTRMFIYDLVRRSWTMATFANSISSLQLILDPNQLPSVLGGDYSTGYVRRYFAGDTTDDGVDVNWTLTLAPLTGPHPLQNVYLRRLLVSTFGFTAGASITATFAYAANILTSTKVVPTIATIVNQTGYGTQAFGQAPYGDPLTANLPGTDVTMEFVPQGGIISNWIVIQLSGTGPGKIRGLGWHHIAKPLTRSVTSVTQS